MEIENKEEKYRKAIDSFNKLFENFRQERELLDKMDKAIKNRTLTYKKSYVQLVQNFSDIATPEEKAQMLKFKKDLQYARMF